MFREKDLKTAVICDQAEICFKLMVLMTAFHDENASFIVVTDTSIDPMLKSSQSFHKKLLKKTNLK